MYQKIDIFLESILFILFFSLSELTLKGKRNSHLYSIGTHLCVMLPQQVATITFPLVRVSLLFILILSRNLLSLQLNYMKKVSLSKLLQRIVNFISEEHITLSYKQRKTCEEWYKLRLSVKILFQRELWIQPLSPINMEKIPVCPKKKTSQYVC